MKNLIARLLMPLSLAVLFITGSAFAQSQPRIMNVNVPFEFSVGKSLFPAGTYSFVRIAPNRINIRDERARIVGSVITNPIEALNAPVLPKLVFSADGHALLRVWLTP